MWTRTLTTQRPERPPPPPPPRRQPARSGVPPASRPPGRPPAPRRPRHCRPGCRRRPAEAEGRDSRTGDSSTLRKRKAPARAGPAPGSSSGTRCKLRPRPPQSQVCLGQVEGVEGCREAGGWRWGGPPCQDDGCACAQGRGAPRSSPEPLRAHGASSARATLALRAGPPAPHTALRHGHWRRARVAVTRPGECAAAWPCARVCTRLCGVHVLPSEQGPRPPPRCWGSEAHAIRTVFPLAASGRGR